MGHSMHVGNPLPIFICHRLAGRVPFLDLAQKSCFAFSNHVRQLNSDEIVVRYTCLAQYPDTCYVLQSILLLRYKYSLQMCLD